MSDLKSTQSGKLFQTFIARCTKKEKRISTVGLFAELVTVTWNNFLLKRKKFLTIYVHKPKY